MAAPDTTGRSRAQRVRVGLTGLACVFLLVMLATAFLRSAGTIAVDNVAAPANAAATPSEPLAELGVVPGNTPPPEPAKAAAPRR